MTFKPLASYQHNPFEKGQPMTSLLSQIEHAIANAPSLLHETETDVQKVIAAFKKGEEVVASDIKAASKWAAGMAPVVAKDLQTALTLLSAIEAVTPSVGANADVKAAVEAAQLATTALSAFATDYNAGASTTASVVNGYVAVKQAQSAVASATAAVAAAPTPAAS